MMEEHTPDERWRQTHLGRLLGHAMRRFDTRVLQLMAASAQAPLALSNLAARDKVGAAHIHITRHLPLDGARLTELAQAAGLTKQSMGDLVDQCEAWGLVTRGADPLDARARRIAFTPAGLDWLAAFQAAVTQAEAEFRGQIDDIGLYYVRSAAGAMIPLTTLLRPQSVSLPSTLQRYNMFRTADIGGEPAHGFSSGQALAAVLSRGA